MEELFFFIAVIRKEADGVENRKAKTVPFRLKDQSGKGHLKISVLSGFSLSVQT